MKKKKAAHQNPKKTIWEKKKSPKMTTKARLDPKKKRIRPLGSIPGESWNPTTGWPLADRWVLTPLRSRVLNTFREKHQFRVGGVSFSRKSISWVPLREDWLRQSSRVPSGFWRKFFIRNLFPDPIHTPYVPEARWRIYDLLSTTLYGWGRSLSRVRK